jgi:hypothetical protein
VFRLKKIRIIRCRCRLLGCWCEYYSWFQTGHPHRLLLRLQNLILSVIFYVVGIILLESAISSHYNIWRRWIRNAKRISFPTKSNSGVVVYRLQGEDDWAIIRVSWEVQDDKSERNRRDYPWYHRYPKFRDMFCMVPRWSTILKNFWELRTVYRRRTSLESCRILTLCAMF